MPSDTEPWSRSSLPRPFITDPWRGDRSDAARTLWDWHQELIPVLEEGGSLEALRGQATAVVEQFDLDLQDVDIQLATAQRMVPAFGIADPDEFDQFVDGWTAAHGRLLAGLAGIGRYTWQRGYIFMMSRGFALTAALMALPEDLARDRLLIPRSDLDHFGVALEDLQSARPTPAVKKVIWKEVVRARDSFAQAQQLIDDLERREAAAFRRWWFAGLEILHVIESNDYDVWNHPPRLSRYRRMHARFQARFGRTTFR